MSLAAETTAREGALKAVRRRRRFDVFPYLMLAPIALLLSLVIVYPLIEAVHLAMTDASLLRLARAKFIGLLNFKRLLKRFDVQRD